MRALVVFAVAGWMTGSAAASDEAATCVAKAAAELRSVPGLVVVASRTKPLPDRLRSSPGISALVIELDVRVADHQRTERFICGYRPAGPVVVDRVGG